MKIMVTNRYLKGRIRPIFFLSPGRTATQWIAYIYHILYNNALAVHEAPPMIRSVGIAYHVDAIKTHQAAKILKAARGPNIAAARNYFKKSFYVEANQNLFSLSAPLRRAFPDCFLVGIVRDIKTWLPSMARKGYRDGVPWFKPKNGYLRDTSGPEKLAIYWKEKIESFRNKVDLIFRYEDIISENGYTMFNNIAEMIGLRMIRSDEFNLVRTHITNGTPKHKHKVDYWDSIPLTEATTAWYIAKGLRRDLGYL